MEDVDATVEPDAERAAVQHGVDEAHSEDDSSWSGRDFAWG